MKSGFETVAQSQKLKAFEHLFVYVNSYNFSKYNHSTKIQINPQR